MIRLFTPVPGNYNPKFKDWAFISLKYLKAFDETKLPIKAINYLEYPNGTLNDEESPFYKYNHLFLTEMKEDPKVNIVVGFGNIFEKYYTDNMINIGITISYPRPQRIEEVKALEKYQAIWAGTQRTQEDLNKIGFEASVVPAEPVIIQMALKEWL